MQERDSFYLGALLHDIGKFIERAKLPTWQENAERYVHAGDASRNYAHRRFSAAFISSLLHKPDLFCNSAAESLALWHHRGNDQSKKDYEPINSKGVLLKLVRIADDCASAERIEDAAIDPQKYYLARLQSIFTEVVPFGDPADLPPPTPEAARYLGLNALSSDKQAFFPETHEPAFQESVHGTPYTGIVDEFIKGIEEIDNEDELLNYLEKYLHAVPAQTPVEFNGKEHLSRTDINLFDHLRTTAAIALCLYDEWTDGSWKGKDTDILDDSSEGYKRSGFSQPCLLVSGDLSGIQDFIFNIPSKKAAKSLKGRSFFVQLLSEVCARYILDRLNLKPVNLLFNGGGNFFILVPACRKSLLADCRKEIERVLLDMNLFLALGWTDVGIADFSSKGGGFSAKWSQVRQEVDRSKLRKFSTLEASLVFSPFLQKPQIEHDVDRYADLTSKLSRKSGYNLQSFRGDASAGWQRPFNMLGYQVAFYDAPLRGGLVFNDTSFEGKWSGFRFAVKGLPEWTDWKTVEDFEKNLGSAGRSLSDYEEDDEKITPGKIKTFSQLAACSLIETGTEKLAVLKMDVDNLGKIFSTGLPENLRTPSRMMVLSRSLKWFFEGYMNTLLNDEVYRNTLYVIFSGGDDFFLVGAWHKVFEFALEVHKAFSEFSGNHPSLTLSASLIVVDEHFPVVRFATLAEDRLHEAKYGSLHKNSINVFGEILTWAEFRLARQIRDRLLELVIDHHESRAIIQKVLMGCDELGLLHERAVNMYKASKDNDIKAASWLHSQKPVGEKVWRMAYFLRDLKKEESKKIAGQIIDAYEKVVFSAMKGKPVNPMAIGVGARWAELACRKKTKVSETTIH